jgi:hypothetical protein
MELDGISDRRKSLASILVNITVEFGEHTHFRIFSPSLYQLSYLSQSLASHFRRNVCQEQEGRAGVAEC